MEAIITLALILGLLSSTIEAKVVHKRHAEREICKTPGRPPFLDSLKKADNIEKKPVKDITIENFALSKTIVTVSINSGNNQVPSISNAKNEELPPETTRAWTPAPVVEQLPTPAPETGVYYWIRKVGSWLKGYMG